MSEGILLLEASGCEAGKSGSGTPWLLRLEHEGLPCRLGHLSRLEMGNDGFWG